jgi:hypothetical protein
VFEKTFQFYSQLVVSQEPITGRMTALDVRVDLNLDGMDFDQFVLYLKDMDCKVVEGAERSKALAMYRRALDQSGRSQLTCDDFV